MIRIRRFIREMKKIPNVITLVRVVLLPLLYYLAFTQQKVLFVVFFIIAGLSDFFDGFIARRLEQISSFGAKFDSLADDLVNFSVLVWLWLFIPEFLRENVVAVIVAFVFFLLYIILELAVHKKRIAMHLYSHKFTNVLLYLFIIFSLLFAPDKGFFFVLVFFVIVSMIEGIVILLFFENIPHDTASIFTLLLKKQKH